MWLLNLWLRAPNIWQVTGLLKGEVTKWIIFPSKKMFIIIKICIIMFILEVFVKCFVLLMWKTGWISISSALLFMMDHLITFKGALRSFVKDISIRRECLNKRNT